MPPEAQGCSASADGTLVTSWSGSTQASTQSPSRALESTRRLAVRSAAAYVSYGSNASTRLLALGADRQKLHTGLNLGDIGYFSTILPGTRRPRTGIFVGGLHPQYGADMLPDLLRMSSLTEIVVCGSGPLTDMLSREPGIRLMGHVPQDEIRELSLGASVFLAPFRIAPFSICVSEALATGTPVVVSTIDGASELVAPTNGVVSPPEPTAFGAAIDRALLLEPGDAVRATLPPSGIERYADAFVIGARSVASTR